MSCSSTRYGIQQSEDLQNIRTRQLILQNPDGSYPEQFSTLYVVSDTGHVGESSLTYDPTGSLTMDSITVKGNSTINGSSIVGGAMLVHGALSVDMASTMQDVDCGRIDSRELITHSDFQTSKARLNNVDISGTLTLHGPVSNYFGPTGPFHFPGDVEIAKSLTVNGIPLLQKIGDGVRNTTGTNIGVHGDRIRCDISGDSLYFSGTSALQGDPGPTGATGILGAPGIPGNPGRPGARGERGTTGVVGSTGVEGSIGIIGRSGAGVQGDIGVSGVSGVVGILGILGVYGNNGLGGQQGLSGIVGQRGPTGGIGLQGATGVSGVTGPIGPTGPSGLLGPAGVIGQSVLGEVGPQGIIGDQGIQGDNGINGNPGPSGLQGLTGPVGEKGKRGIDGAIGIPGMVGGTGVTGMIGKKGIIGTIGRAGNTGEDGIIGETGIPGITGITGVRGINGYDGINGARGPRGPVGQQGPSGVQGPIGPTGPTPGPIGVTGIGPPGYSSPGFDGFTGASGPMFQTIKNTYEYSMFSFHTTGIPGFYIPGFYDKKVIHTLNIRDGSYTGQATYPNIPERITAPSTIVIPSTVRFTNFIVSTFQTLINLQNVSEYRIVLSDTSGMSDPLGPNDRTIFIYTPTNGTVVNDRVGTAAGKYISSNTFIQYSPSFYDIWSTGTDSSGAVFKNMYVKLFVTPADAVVWLSPLKLYIIPCL